LPRPDRLVGALLGSTRQGDLFVAWRYESETDAGRNGMFGTRVTALGEITERRGHRLPELSRLFGGSSGYLAIRQDGDAVSGVSLDRSGAPTTMPMSIASNVAGSICAAFDGSNYLVAWISNPIYAGEVHAVRISGAGSLLDSNPFPIDVSPIDPATYRELHGCVHDGTHYLVLTGIASLGLFVTSISPQGSVTERMRVDRFFRSD